MRPAIVLFAILLSIAAHAEQTEVQIKTYTYGKASESERRADKLREAFDAHRATRAQFIETMEAFKTPQEMDAFFNSMKPSTLRKIPAEWLRPSIRQLEVWHKVSPRNASIVAETLSSKVLPEVYGPDKMILVKDLVGYNMRNWNPTIAKELIEKGLQNFWLTDDQLLQLLKLTENMPDQTYWHY